MDESEALADSYLRSLGRGVVIFEPDGRSKPPDFSVGGGLAVEVRRLNQNYETQPGIHKGLEDQDISLREWIESHLRSVAPSRNGECWYVGYDFRRHIGNWKKFKRYFEESLLNFLRDEKRTPRKVQVTDNFVVEFFRSSVDHGSFFVLGGCMDLDSGGWVLSEMERNLLLCTREKEAKLADHRSRYAEWWLVLVDHIGYAVDIEERPRFMSGVIGNIPHSFDRIVLLDPLGRNSALEV